MVAKTQLTNDYVEGAPEFLAEISASTVSIDLGDQKAAYERNGVQEYLVWGVLGVCKVVCVKC